MPAALCFCEWQRTQKQGVHFRPRVALAAHPLGRVAPRRRRGSCATFAAGAVAVQGRALVEHGLAVRARYVILAHNHPSGDPEPSTDDLAFTRRLAETLRTIDMPLADHLIVTRDTITSLRERGLL